VSLLNIAGNQRALLMIDEFQRVEVLRGNQQADINAALHGLFNQCSHGLSLLLSFSFGVEENLRHFLNGELLSRVDPLRITIPVLTSPEAVEFLEDVIRQARSEATDPRVSIDLVPTIVSALAPRFRLTPRRLIKAAALVFELGAIELEDGAIETLSASYVQQMVAEGNFDRIDDKEDVT